MRRLFSIFMFSISSCLFGQNLVPNASFEDHYNCASEWLYISNSIGWTQMQTSDYYNSCIIPTWIIHSDVPKNTLGYQQAKTGSAYAGIGVFYSSNYRECIQTNLPQPLIANVNYCVSFNVSLADTSLWAVNKIGAYFSVDTIIWPYVGTTMPPDYHIFTYYNPQIESNFLLTDTANWTKIEGAFLASGNENFMTIGNFRDDISTDTITVRTTGNYTASYYYIDDISVEKVLNANAGNDTSITTIDSLQLGNNPTENATYLWQPSIGLNDSSVANPMARPSSTTIYIVTKTQCSVITTDTVIVYNLSVGINGNSNDSFKLYPNPTEGQFNFSGLKKESAIEIFDVAGRLIFKTVSESEKQTINLADKENGIYFYRVTSEIGNVRQGKIILQ